jgi:hypothetical protein
VLALVTLGDCLADIRFKPPAVASAFSGFASSPIFGRPSFTPFRAGRWVAYLKSPRVLSESLMAV